MTDDGWREANGRDGAGFTRAAGNLAIRSGFEVVVEEILNALIDGAEVPGERAIFFAAEREKMIHERGEATDIGLGGEARLADFAELEVEVGDELGVGGARIISGEVGGGGVVSHVEGGGGANRV